MLYSSPLNMFSFMITNLFCCSFRHPSPSSSLSGDEFNCLCLLPKETSLFIASLYLQNLCVYYSLSHSFHDDEQEWHLLLQTAQDSFLEVFGEGKQEESSKKKIRGRKTFGFWVLFTIFSLSLFSSCSESSCASETAAEGKRQVVLSTRFVCSWSNFVPSSVEAVVKQ